MNFISKWLVQRKINNLPVGDDMIITDSPIDVQFYPPVELMNVCDSLGILDIESHAT